jgi:hypothetical protein
MSHLADAETWQDFNIEYPVKDVRNFRLGLATDGFNPFCKRTQNTICGMCFCCAIQPSSLGMHGGVKLYDGFAYLRSS